MTVQGSVELVTSEELGAVVVEWSGTTMLVADGSQLAVDGGTLSADGGDTTIDYASVQWGRLDSDPDVVTTLTPAPEGWMDSDERWVQVWPPAVEVTATVGLPEGGQVLAVVPHALRPLLTDGVRGPGQAESVSCELVDGTWMVSDVLGRRGLVGIDGLDTRVTTTIHDASDAAAAAALTADRASAAADRLAERADATDADVAVARRNADAARAAADAAAAEAQQASATAESVRAAAEEARRAAGTAQAAADGKNVIVHAQSDPSRSGTTTGDTWFRHTWDGTTTGMWSWDGSEWVPMDLSGQVIASIDAGKITTGTLSGIDIYSPGPATTPRVHVGGSQVEVIRSDDDGQEITTVSLGGPDTDRMVLSDHSGSPIAGFEQDGALLATSATVNGTLTVDGDDIMDIIGRLPQGVVARQKLGSTSSLNNITYGSSDLGLLELQIPMTAGRLYRFVASGMAWSGGPGRLVLMAKMTTDGSAPTISSPRAGMAAFTTDGSTRVEFTLFLPVQASDVTARILLTARQQTSPDGGHLLSDDTYPFDIYVEDVGTYPSWGDGAVNTGGGTPLQGGTVTPTAPAVTTRTTTWNAAAVRSWRGGSTVTDSLRHGYYGGYQGYSLALWGSQPSDVLSAAGVHIQGVWLYLRNLSWFNYVGGYARIGHFDSTALPGSPQTSGGGAFTTKLWKPGAGMWIPIPRGWWSGIARGTIRGFTLGEGAGTSADRYGKFSAALSDIKLKVTYTK